MGRGRCEKRAQEKKKGRSGMVEERGTPMVYERGWGTGGGVKTEEMEA